MKKFIAMILCIATCFSLAITCSATFSTAAKTTKLFTSYAGYVFNIDDYYNTMRKFAGRGEYKCEWHQTSNHKNEYYTLSNCWIDTTGKIHISINTRGTTGIYRNYNSWVGIACNEKGDFNFTYTDSDGEYYDLAWNGTYQKGTWTYYDFETKQKVTETDIDMNDFDESWMAEYISETIREVYWKDIYYDCTGFIF